MKIPSFGSAELQARVALAAGRCVEDTIADVLGLQFWWQFPRHLRATRAGQHRPAMVRQYVQAIREHQHAVSDVSGIIGEVTP